MSKFNPTNFNWTVERNCSCELPLICIRPIKFRNPILCINSAIDVNNFENFLKKSPVKCSQQISPISPQNNFENCSTEQKLQTLFNTTTASPLTFTQDNEYNSTTNTIPLTFTQDNEYNSTTTTTPQSYTQYNFSFWLVYTLLGLILILQLLYWINIILRKIRRRHECKLIRKRTTQFHEKTRGAPTSNTPTTHRRGDPIPTVSEMTPLKIIAPTLGEMKKTHVPDNQRSGKRKFDELITCTPPKHNLSTNLSPPTAPIVRTPPPVTSEPPRPLTPPDQISFDKELQQFYDSLMFATVGLPSSNDNVEKPIEEKTEEKEIKEEIKKKKRTNEKSKEKTEKIPPEINPIIEAQNAPLSSSSSPPPIRITPVKRKTEEVESFKRRKEDAEETSPPQKKDKINLTKKPESEEEKEQSTKAQKNEDDKIKEEEQKKVMVNVEEEKKDVDKEKVGEKKKEDNKEKVVEKKKEKEEPKKGEERKKEEEDSKVKEKKKDKKDEEQPVEEKKKELPKENVLSVLGVGKKEEEKPKGTTVLSTLGVGKKEEKPKDTPALSAIGQGKKEEKKEVLRELSPYKEEEPLPPPPKKERKEDNSTKDNSTQTTSVLSALGLERKESWTQTPSPLLETIGLKPKEGKKDLLF
uniref:Uncharacterized protein n=1 Tax=Meloidogyne floridensis TaxID=298350 RepID=A0A915NSI2_9BILA